jgi:ribosomal protein L11 methyltransferase
MNAELRFPFVLVDTDADEADLLSSQLFDLGAQGVEERDASTLVKNRGVMPITLVASFASQEEAQAALTELKNPELFPESLNPALEQIIGDAWRDAWKVHFRPFVLCDNLNATLVVRPPWESYEPKPGERILELEPGRAFGTGLHETTTLVARVLSARASELAGTTVLDVGTGSGILALTALMLGAAHARATDNDPDVIGVVMENAERNGLSDRILADTTDIAEVTGSYPFVLANIEAHVLIPMAKALSQRVAKGGTLVLSGILTHQKEDVVAAYSDLSLASAPQRGEWIALELRKG